MAELHFVLDSIVPNQRFTKIIVNMSWGFPYSILPSLEDVINVLAMTGKVSLNASAGNKASGFGWVPPFPQIPADYYCVQAIGASDTAGYRNDTSNYGGTLVLAPFRALTAGFDSDKFPGEYDPEVIYFNDKFKGTSASCPHAVGVIANLLNKDSRLGPFGAARIMADNTYEHHDTIPFQGYDIEKGFGNIEMGAAMAWRRPHNSNMLGDVVGDSMITLDDVIALAHYTIGSYDGVFIESNADVNCDGTINLGDAEYLVEYILRDGPAPGDCYGEAITETNPFALNNYPNPFNPATTTQFFLATESDWKLDIINIMGQKVASYSGSGKGLIRVTWSGVDNFNDVVASGIYFYRLDTGNDSLVRKMMLLK